jgi:hypothetical protein
MKMELNFEKVRDGLGFFGVGLKNFFFLIFEMIFEIVF